VEVAVYWMAAAAFSQIPVDEESGSGSVAGLNRAIRVLSRYAVVILSEAAATKDGQVAVLHGVGRLHIDSRPVPLCQWR